MSFSHPYGRLLLSNRRPQQYTGAEWNSAQPANSGPRVTLVYPDVYELGMSNFALSILRHLLLSTGLFDVRRAFCPAPDMDSGLSEKGIPWVDLEGYDPVAESRVVGFSVPSEILYSNVLHLLDLMGLPLRSRDRDQSSPLILLGGGGLANPMPIAPFADVIFLGEAEERAVELFRVLCGEGPRESILAAASKIPGVFVPSIGKNPVEFQRIPKLRREDAPVHQLVPVAKVSQDRGVVEVARGCTRGCRFCQASQIYRPVRERSPKDCADIAGAVLDSTGWEKLGLLTLSLSDHSRLEELLSGVEDVCRRRRAALGRPSMRPDTVTRLAGEGGITGRVTLAPEAGSTGMRRRINKPMDEEVILDAVDTVFQRGARGVKLYFILGLPEETDEDVAAIGHLALAAARIARRHRRRPRKAVSISLSPFVPKAQTPLQWAPQMPEDEIWRRINLVKKICGRKVDLGWNSPRVAMVEGMMSVGDDGAAADMLEEAVRRGARFDAWSDRFRWDIWSRLAEENSEPLKVLQRGRELHGKLPWDFVSTGVSCDFLRREYEAYFSSGVTPDCRLGSCSRCGACYGGSGEGPRWKTAGEEKTAESPVQHPVAVLRVRYSKTGPGSLTSHLDMVRMWGRVLRRSCLPAAWSGGYVTRPRVQFGPPLPLGIPSRAEYLDVSLCSMPEEGAGELLDRFLPRGFAVEESWLLECGAAPPDAGTPAAEYRAVVKGCAEEAAAFLMRREGVFRAEALNQDELIFLAPAKKRETRPDLLLRDVPWEIGLIERTEIFAERAKNKGRTASGRPSQDKYDGWVALCRLSRDLEKNFIES